MRTGNIKTVHRKNGTIRFIVNDEVCLEQIYGCKETRANMITHWQQYNRFQKKYVIEIIPNWDIWNGKF